MFNEPTGIIIKVHKFKFVQNKQIKNGRENTKYKNRIKLCNA